MHLMGGAGLALGENEVELGVGVDTGQAQDHGIDPLADADILHISPSHHFPTGLVTPLSRRQELLGRMGIREFDVRIPPEEIVPENFNSAEALMALITKIDEE